MHQAYAYRIDYYRTDGSRIGSVSVDPEWSSALESAHFQGVRQRRLHPTTAPVVGTIDPIFEAPGERPEIRGVRVLVPVPDGGEPVSCEIPRSYLRPLAEQQASRFVEQGLLERGAAFHYVVSVFPRNPTAARTLSGPSGEFELESVAEEIDMEERSMGPLIAESIASGTTHDDDAPVFIPRRVVAEAFALSAAAKENETGGVLIGKLRRARGAAEAFIEVTAQVPALHTESTAVKLTFTEDTWAAVRGVIELRAEQELMLGWWHSHPHFCAKCPTENRARCAYAADFFSKDDVFLHRTCFPRGYQVALLLSDHGGPALSTAMFGWHRGEVAARGFFVVNPIPTSARARPILDAQPRTHETRQQRHGLNRQRKDDADITH